MKLLTEISAASLGLEGGQEKIGGEYRLRKSARAILLNHKGEMATQYLETYAYHKLPGGGIELGESPKQALSREVREEVGCECVVEGEVGVVIEYHNDCNLLHISYCYVAQVVGDIGEPKLEEGEQEEGQVTLWLPPKELLAKMRSDVSGEFKGHFILKREISFLEEYLKSQPKNEPHA